jgi:hypothetical protein
MVSFAIAENIALRVLVTEPIRQKLLAHLAGAPATAPPA